MADRKFTYKQINEFLETYYPDVAEEWYKVAPLSRLEKLGDKKISWKEWMSSMLFILLVNKRNVSASTVQTLKRLVDDRPTPDDIPE